MKSKIFILAAFLLAAAQLSAQYETSAPVDEKTGFVTYSRIVPVENVSAGDLYSRAQSWFATFYASAQDVLQQQDAGRSLLVGRSFFNLANDGGHVYYTITVRCKDGRVRADVSHLQHEHLIKYAGQMPNYGNIESWVAGTTGLPKYITKNLPKVAAEIYADATALLDAFERSVSAASETSDDW